MVRLVRGEERENDHKGAHAGPLLLLDLEHDKGERDQGGEARRDETAGVVGSGKHWKG